MLKHLLFFSCESYHRPKPCRCFFFGNFSKASSYCLPKKYFGFLADWMTDLKPQWYPLFLEKKEKTLSFWETEHNVLTSLWIQQYIWFFSWLVSDDDFCEGMDINFAVDELSFFWRMTIMKCRLIVFLTHLPNRSSSSSSSRPWPSQTQPAYDHQTCSERTWTKYDHCAKI